jgi:hypothetical protein
MFLLQRNLLLGSLGSRYLSYPAEILNGLHADWSAPSQMRGARLDAHEKRWQHGFKELTPE